MLGGKLTIEGVSVGLSERLAVSVNKSIADVREPENRNCDFTKTLKIPATPEVNALFEWAYDVNIDFQSFNPNKSTPGSYFLDTTEVIRGNIQLLAIPQVYNRGFYEIVIRGTNADIFIEMEGLFLTDLSFTDLNHTLTYANFSATPTIGVGYCYGYLDYGMNGVNGFNWNVLHFKAAIWLKEYVDRIFVLLGRTYTSTFLTSTFFKSIAMPCNKAGMYLLDPTSLANKVFYANKTATQTQTFVTTSVGPNMVLAADEEQFVVNGVNPVIFQDDSTPPFNDPGGIYNTGTGIFTANTPTPTVVTFVLSFEAIIANVAAGMTGTAVNFLVTQSSIPICIRKNGVIVSTFTYNFSNTNWPVASNQVVMTGIIPVSYSDPNPIIGDQYTASVSSSTINGFFEDSTPANCVPNGLCTMTIVLKTGSTFYNTLPSTNAYWGDTIDMNTVVPEDIKMKDFFMWVVRKFNLYFEIDKQNPLNYIIERRDNFFLSSNYLDLDPLWDTSKEFTVLPMGELDFKTITVRDKQDSDYWNKLYQDKYKQVYGQQRIDVDNDFIRTEKIIETGFSPTPAVSFQTDIIAPRFLQIEGAFPGGTYTVKPMKTNPRLLYWGGIKNCNTHGLVQSPTSGLVAMNTYPSLNHIDDAASPTVDLNFSSPYEVFYQKPGQVWTNNTQYNAGYKKFITEIIDPDSKIVKMYAMLTQDQIYNFTFRRLCYWKGALFYVNSFENDDIQSGGSTMLELLKLKPAAALVVVQYDPYNPPSGQGRISFTNPEYTDRGNYGNYDNANIGRNLNNGAGIGLMVGENVQVDRAVQRFTGLGIKDQIIGLEMEGMVKITEGMVISDNGIEKVKMASSAAHTANFSVTKPLEFIDASGGNVDFILPDASLMLDVIVTRIDNSGNTVTGVGFLGTELIRTNGVSATTNVLPTRTTRTYRTDGTNWYY